MRPQVLAESRFFRQYGRQGNWRWAEMPVSQEQTHGVALDTATGATYCTCPFRPRPCVHAQAFALVAQAVAAEVFAPCDELPAWLAIASGAKPTRRTSAPLAVPTSEEERINRAQRGLEDLEAWLDDGLRRGLATAASEDQHFYLTAATRLADASMRNLSRRLRTAGKAFVEHPDQPASLLATLADAAIAIQAFRRREHLSKAQRSDWETFLGFTQKKETVRLHGERLQDTWAIVGIAVEWLEASLRERRTWLLGAQSGRFALLLDYAFGAEGFPPALAAGALVQGELAFYPSAWPLRALPVEALSTVPGRQVRKLPGWSTFSEMAHTFARALTHQPWLAALPAVLQEVRLWRCAKGFGLADKEGYWVPLRNAEAVGWVLLAGSEGRPITVFGEWDGEQFEALSFVCAERFIHLYSICEPSSLEAASSD